MPAENGGFLFDAAGIRTYGKASTSYSFPDERSGAQMGTLYDNLNAVLNSPRSVRERGEAIRNLMRSAAMRSPLVRRVLAGEITFAQYVAPLYGENNRIRFPFRNGACNSEKFEKNAGTIWSSLQGIFRLYTWMEDGIGRNTLVSLLDVKRLNTARYIRCVAAFIFVAVTVLVLNYFLSSEVPVLGFTSYLKFTSIIALFSGFSGFLFAYKPDQDYVKVRREFAERVMHQAFDLDKIVNDYCRP